MEKFLIIILILQISGLFTIAFCEIYFSISHIEEYVVRAKVQNSELKEVLKSYIDEQMGRMERAERSIQELHNLSGDEIKDPTFKITHPFNAFRFIRNHSDIFNSSLMKAVAEISSFENETLAVWESNCTQLTKDLPNFEDLNGTALALQRIQTTYNASTNDIADGSLIDAPDSKLTADECRDVSAVLHTLEFHATGRSWMEEAKHRKCLAKASNASVETAMRVSARSALKTGNVIAAMLAIGGKSRPNYVDRKTTLIANRIRSEFMHFVKTSHPVESSKMKRKAFDNYSRGPVYTNLCTGQSVTKQAGVPFKDTLLFCRYETNGHPYLMLQPVKYEQRSLNPYIVEYHDVFSDQDIQTMKKEAKENMTSINKVGYDGQGLAMVRINVRAFIYNNTARLIDKVSAITSLQAGGDAAQTTDNDPIATLMVYMSDVEMGGATIFPNATVTVFPKKGSAVFWRNMYRNVTAVDKMATHSACPVLKGDKWVATFLIREKGQEFRLPCTLNEFE